MAKRFGSGKVSTLHAVILGVVFLLAAISTVALINYGMRQQALAEAKSKMRLMLDRNLAVHAYFSEDLKPNLLEWTEPFRSDDYFDPTWMSSTYAIREMGERSKTHGLEGYYYKDAAVGARNPKNEADAVERAFIEELNTNQSLEESSDVRTIDGQPYLVVLRRGEVLERGCLQCHGDPNDAPKDLVRQYGSERSFNRQAELGDVISAVSARVPVAAAYAEADRVSKQLATLLLAILGSVYVGELLVSRHLVFAPLDAIRDKALQISGDPERLGEQIPVPPGGELATLVQGFNTMSLNLREGWQHLEARVQERTADLQRSEESLRNERDLAEGMISTAQTIVLMLDIEGRIVRFNPYMEEVSGYTIAEVQGKDWFTTFLPEREQERISRLFSKAIGDIQTRGEVSLIVTKDGSECEIEWYDKTLRDTQGNVLGLLAIGQDVTERNRAEAELRRTEASVVEANRRLQEALAREQRLARLDSLTGVNNRRYWFELAGHELEVAERYSRPISVIVFDVDGFKLVNDTFGHAVGDEVLARVAAVASAELRAADAIGRYGGDEFVMVLPMTTAQQAYHIAERMRTSIAEMRLDVGEGQVAVTVSIGIADVLPVTEECPGGVCSLGDILYRADAAMYLAKAAGRNRISVYS